MLTNLKSWLYGSVAAIMAILVALVKYQSNKATNAKQEAEEAETEALNANQRADIQSELLQVKAEYQKKAVQNEKSIQKIKESGARPATFSDNSMLDD